MNAVGVSAPATLNAVLQFPVGVVLRPSGSDAPTYRSLRQPVPVPEAHGVGFSAFAEGGRGTLLAQRKRMRQRCVRQTVVWLALTGAALACSGSKQIGVSPADGAAGEGGQAEPLAPAAGGAASGIGGATSDTTPNTSGSAGALPGGGIPVCESPRVEASSQLVVCANGFVHRAKPAVCGSGAAGSGGAASDDTPSTAGAPDQRNPYTTGCSDDSDCPSGSACVCDGAAFLFNLPPGENAQGLCVLATCKTDADCGPHSYCAVGNLDFFGEANPGFACLQADDECTTDADCKSDGLICFQGYEETKRTCSPPPV